MLVCVNVHGERGWRCWVVFVPALFPPPPFPAVNNLARCKKYGVSLLIQSALNRNKEDGQLQWRGSNVLKQLASFRRNSIIDALPPPSKQVGGNVPHACYSVPVCPI